MSDEEHGRGRLPVREMLRLTGATEEDLKRVGITVEDLEESRRESEQFWRRHEAADRAAGWRDTYINIQDIAVLVVNGEYVFTLRQLLTRAQKDGETEYWLNQPPEEVQAANAAVEKFFDEFIRPRQPATGPKLAPGEVRIRVIGDID